MVIGSKNVPAPGPGAAAYSASKAALQQLARVAALEWAGDGIRVNTPAPGRGVRHRHLDAMRCSRRAPTHYGMTVEQYKRKNLLQDRGHQPRRRRARRRAVRPAVRQDHRGADSGGRRERSGDLAGRVGTQYVPTGTRHHPTKMVGTRRRAHPT
ncbi:MAG: SDR family NAD(P)-dependent oxidoreductase [Chromatiales bacterium]|nr:SDR family NAD(P)-dependent oxidoreductase [Chromatiales bacterium]